MRGTNSKRNIANEALEGLREYSEHVATNAKSEEVPMAKVIDANKLLKPLRKGITLNQLAAEINALGKMEGDVRLALAIRVVRAKELCQKGRLNMPFEMWCHVNLRKASGEPYADSTIYEYLRIGTKNDPAAELGKLRAVTKRARQEAGAGVGLRNRTSVQAESFAKAEKIKNYAKAHPALNGKQIAEKFGISKSSVHNYMKGKTGNPERFYADELGR